MAKRITNMAGDPSWVASLNYEVKQMNGLKQGINFLMPIEIGTDLNLVERIVFVAEQGTNRKTWTYPSTTATRITGTNKVELKWTWEDTFDFDADALITLDSKIFVSGSIYNPPTEKVVFKMDSTLFSETEIEEMDD